MRALLLAAAMLLVSCASRGGLPVRPYFSEARVDATRVTAIEGHQATHVDDAVALINRRS